MATQPRKPLTWSNAPRSYRLMDTVNFQCGHCGKLMAVTSALLGRQVRCPHCQQVVVAPSRTPVVPPPFPESMFQQPAEHESIFSPPEEADDLFGTSSPPQPEMPSQPMWQPPPEPEPVNLELTAVPPPPEQTVVYTPPPEQTSSPFVASSPPTSGSESSNPWLTLPESANQSGPATESTLEAPPSFTAGPRPKRQAPSWLLPVLIIPLISYSIVVTALLAYCYMQLEFERSNDPLKRLLDEGYNPAATKPSSKTGLRGPINWGQTPLRPLPPSLKTTLNQPIRVGDLEVTPRAVEMRKVLIKTGNANPEPGTAPSLVLFLELKNVSDDVEFYPLDPWFDRHYKENAQKAYIPFTYLEMGNKRFFGGPAINEGEIRETLLIDGIDADLEHLPGKKLRQNADQKLKPGEKMISFVATDSEHNVRAALQGHTGPLVYRVRVRNGLIPWGDQSIPTTAVIGVEFTKQDIKDLSSS